MMKQQIRIIRISFCICAALAIGAFWAGFYFGNTQLQTEQQIADGSSGIYTAEADVAEPEDGEESESHMEDTVESMNTLSPDKYYLKANGTYLSVYRGSAGEVYFDTDLKLSDLPASLPIEAKEGIAFESLEEVYGFLENYSS